jgi:hypothetical protein
MVFIRSSAYSHHGLRAELMIQQEQFQPIERKIRQVHCDPFSVCSVPRLCPESRSTTWAPQSVPLDKYLTHCAPFLSSRISTSSSRTISWLQSLMSFAFALWSSKSLLYILFCIVSKLKWFGSSNNAPFNLGIFGTLVNLGSFALVSS